MKLFEEVGTKDRWRERWRWIRQHSSYNVRTQRLQESQSRSLGCIKLVTLTSVIVEETGSEWTGRKRAVIDQMALFDPGGNKA